MVAYLDVASEGALIEEVVLPLFRQLGFHRITAAGHRDKALEYGKDLWMKYILPTQRVLYFGIHAKKGKLDATTRSQIMFMDRNNILHLFAVTNLPVPAGALPKAESADDDDLPF